MNPATPAAKFSIAKARNPTDRRSTSPITANATTGFAAARILEWATTPANKTKSIVLTKRGLQESERLFKELFAKE